MSSDAVTQAKSRAAIIRSSPLQFDSDNFSLTLDVLSSVQLHTSSKFLY